ncbi:9157_t:CDS:2, partial [Dentiscutata erythropus]
SPGATEAPYSFETVVSFISQGQMPDNRNTASINSCESFFRTTKAQNNDSLIINPYQNITSVETPLNIYPYGAAKISSNMFPFVYEGPAQDNNLLIINPYHYPLLAILTISLLAVKVSQNAFLFVHEGPAQNNDPLIINLYPNITPSFNSYLNNFSSLETPNPYNNIIPSSNIYAYRTNEQSFLLPFSPFIRSMQNNDPLTIDLSQSTNNSNYLSSFETTNLYNNYYYSS